MRVYAALLFLCSVSLLPFAARADILPTADELKARNLAAVGAEPDNLRETVVSTGTLGATTTTNYTLGKDERHILEHGPIHSENGTYQGETWVQNENGLTIAVAAPAGKEAGDKTTTVVRHITTPVDAYVVSTDNVRHEGTRTFYDASTYRIFRIETYGPSGTTVQSIDEFTSFGSLVREKRWTETSTASHLEQHYERTDYTPGAATPDDVREPPTRRILVEFPSGITDVTLPVQIVNNYIVVRVMFGTRGADFVLDTGASMIFMDQGLATQLGLHLINATSVVTAQRYTSYGAIVPDMAIGPLHMHNVAVRVGPLSMPEGETATAVGLLGFDFLAQLGVTIDYQNKTVRVTPAANYVPPQGPGTYEIPIRIGDGVPETTVRIGNAVAENMLFDTGGYGNLAFFDYFTRRYPDTFHNSLGRSQLIGVGGLFYADVFKFPQLYIGPIQIRDAVGVRMPPDSYTGTQDGLIGNTLLSLFTIGLDYTDARVFLTLNNSGKASERKR